MGNLVHPRHVVVSVHFIVASLLFLVLQQLRMYKALPFGTINNQMGDSVCSSEGRLFPRRRCLLFLGAGKLQLQRIRPYVSEKGSHEGKQVLYPFVLSYRI